MSRSSKCVLAILGFAGIALAEPSLAAVVQKPEASTATRIGSVRSARPLPDVARAVDPDRPKAAGHGEKMRCYQYGRMVYEAALQGPNPPQPGGRKIKLSPGHHVEVLDLGSVACFIERASTASRSTK
ncbi:MAG: hypothetical protein R3E48_16320 [Burkholderiaceae bacterium]